MSLNLSLMESGLADRVQPQTHFMSSLPWSLSSSHSPIAWALLHCSHRLLLLLQDLFWKDTEVKLVCFHASCSLLQDFFPTLTLRETESRLKPFYSLQKRALLCFMVTEPQINPNWQLGFIFQFPFPPILFFLVLIFITPNSVPSHILCVSQKAKYLNIIS